MVIKIRATRSIWLEVDNSISMKMLFSSREPKILSSYAYIYSQEKHIVCVNDTVVSISSTIGSFSVDVINS